MAQAGNELVSAAETTITNFLRDPQMTWLQTRLGDGKCWSRPRW
jgi:hypothetical protein